MNATNISRRGRRGGVVVAAFLLAGVSTSMVFATPRGLVKNRLLLNGERVIKGTTVALSAVDMRDVRLNNDDARAQQTVQLSLFVARGKRAPADKHGALAARDFYEGPLRLRILRGDGGRAVDRIIEFDRPNSPLSTPRRRLYRTEISQLEPGDRLVVDNINGWLAEPTSWTIAAEGSSRPWSSTALATLVSFMVFGGLLSLALVLGRAKATS